MLRILEAADRSAYAELCKALSAPADVHVSEAMENDGVKGFILYAYQPGQVVIFALEDGHDLNYCDGLVRSVLFKAELKGIERAEFRISDEKMRERLKMLKFVQNDENILEPIADVMENCKSCGHNPTNT